MTSDEDRSGDCARILCARKRGLRFGREPNCVRGRKTSVRARTELCARKTVIPWTRIIVWDVRSIRVLVPDARGLDQNFHDVTIVDMGDVPEVLVPLPELSVLREQWPPAVFRHMVWLQQDLEMMRADAKIRFRQTKPMPCDYCGSHQVQHVSACC